MTETGRSQRTSGPDWLLAIVSGMTVEVLIELTRPIAGLWFAPLREVWEDLFVLHDWQLVRSDIVAGFWLYATISFLLFAILWVRRGADHFEEVLSSRGRQIAFLIAILVTGVLVVPHLQIGPEKPCPTAESNVSHR
jgi:hypothetical protein